MRLYFILLLICVVARAHAAPAAPDPNKEARDHYEKGLSHYNLGEFSDAIDEFKRAYEISKAPRLLFNLAQAQRLNKDYEQALYSYTTYLRLMPDAPNRVDVAARIAEMSRLLKEEREHTEKEEPPKPPPPTETPPPPVVTPPPVVVAPPPPPPPPPKRTLLWAGIGVAAGGVALLGAAAGCTGVAASDGSQLDALKASHGPWDAHYQSIYDEGQRLQTASAALWAIGGAVTVAGGVMAILGVRRAHRLAVAPLPGGGAVGWSGSF